MLTSAASSANLGSVIGIGVETCAPTQTDDCQPQNRNSVVSSPYLSRTRDSRTCVLDSRFSRDLPRPRRDGAVGTGRGNDHRIAARKSPCADMRVLRNETGMPFRIIAKDQILPPVPFLSGSKCAHFSGTKLECPLESAPSVKLHFLCLIFQERNWNVL